MGAKALNSDGSVEPLLPADEGRVRGGGDADEALRGMTSAAPTRAVVRDELTVGGDGRLVAPEEPPTARPSLAAPRTGLPAPRFVNDLPAAIRDATRGLEDYIAARGSAITYPMLMVPFDGTRRFRLGDMGTDGFGMTPDDLTRRRDLLIDRGFPAYNEAENAFIGSVNYLARARGGREICLQHFPGGGPELETTERVPVHYGDPAQVRGFVDNYRDAMTMRPPEAIMLSHATYARDGFPGIDDTQWRTRPGFLRDIPFEAIPASLNPAIVGYLRGDLGHAGRVVPDWYDMGAIRDFVSTRTHIDLGEPGDEGSNELMYQNEVRAFVLALEAGVDQIPSMHPQMATHRAWEALQRNHPTEYAETVRRLDERVQGTYARIAPPGSPPIDLTRLSFDDKVRLLIYNPNAARTYDPEYVEPRNSTDPERRRIYEIFTERGLGDYDVWNRTGVMTLLFRQKVVESLTGRRFGEPPSPDDGNEGEVRWFTTLMANREFRAVYDRVPWQSPDLIRVYEAELERRAAVVAQAPGSLGAR